MYDRLILAMQFSEEDCEELIGGSSFYAYAKYLGIEHADYRADKHRWCALFKARLELADKFIAFASLEDHK